MSKLLLVAALLLVVPLASSCDATPPESPTASVPIIGSVIPTGEVEVRDLVPTTEIVSNCGGGGGTIVKHPSMSVLTSHAVEWEVGGEAGVGATIGEGIIPGGVDLSAALDTHIRFGQEGDIQQSTGWDLPAQPNTIMEYTLMWREIWQPGYIEVRLADQSTVRVNVRYRTGIQSEIIGQRPLSCDSGQRATPTAPQPAAQPASVATRPSATSTTVILSTQALCPVTIPQNEADSWHIGEVDVPTVHSYIDDFNSHRPGNLGNFGAGDTIPSGVVVATNFDERNANRWKEFPVIALVHSGSWGLFQTTAEYIAPNEGACLSIVP